MSSHPEAAPAAAGPEYVIGHSARELERLSAQARLLEPFTRRLFEDAGLAPGMRVLDVGCGHGDVTLLAAEIVGPSGHVVALDCAPAAVEATRRRTASISNVDVVQAELAEASFERPFDAVVGRLVLMYCEHPAQALRTLAGCVRPGGLVAFQEWDLDGYRSQPDAPLYDRSARLVIETLRRAGVRTGTGLDLSSTFQEAGLPAPRLAADAPIGGADFELFEVLADAVGNLLPAIERIGLGTGPDLQVETLAARLRDEARTSGRAVIWAPLVGAHARAPAVSESAR